MANGERLHRVSIYCSVHSDWHATEKPAQLLRFSRIFCQTIIVPDQNPGEKGLTTHNGLPFFPALIMVPARRKPLMLRIVCVTSFCWALVGCAPTAQERAKE